MIDTANRRFFFLTTASRPFGLVNLSPDTRVGQNAWKSGYRYVDDSIHWFSHVQAGDVLQFRIGISYCGVTYARDNIHKEG